MARTPSGGAVYHQINVARPGLGAGWRDDFRIPDLVRLSAERRGIDRDAYFDGGPDVVVEIQSPDDESLAKLPFYAAVGRREVWVIDRDTKAPAVHLATGEGLVLAALDADGWVRSPSAEVWLRAEAGRLLLQRGDDASSRRALPEPASPAPSA